MKIGILGCGVMAETIRRYIKTDGRGRMLCGGFAYSETRGRICREIWI